MQKNISDEMAKKVAVNYQELPLTAADYIDTMSKSDTGSMAMLLFLRA